MPFPAAFSSFTRITSALQEIQKQFHRSDDLSIDQDFVYGKSGICQVKEDWRVLGMFSESIHMLCIADDDVNNWQDGREYLSIADANIWQSGVKDLWQLACKIDDAAEEIADYLEEQDKQIKIENQQYSMSEILWKFLSCHGTKTEHLMAKMGEALDLHLSSFGAIRYSWSFLANLHSPLHLRWEPVHFPRPYVFLLLSFAKSVRTHLQNMTPILRSLIVDFSISEYIDVLALELSFISNYINDLEFSSSPGGDEDDDKSCRIIADAFLSHFASVLVNFAIQSCNYLIHRKSTTTSDSLTPIGLLKDSHHQIDPTNSKFMEFHVSFLEALNKIPRYRLDFVKFFCCYLIRDRGRYTHLTDVYSLIISFLEISKIEEEEVVRSFRQEITAVLLEIATLFEPKRIQGANSGPANMSPELLTKICLVKAELCLRKQIHKISSSSSSNGFSFDVISSCRLDIEQQFYHILETLRRYSKDVPHEKLEYGKKTLDLVERIHEESSPLFSSFQLKQITEEYKLKNSLLLLLLKIALFKAESFLMELSLRNKGSSSSAAATIMDFGGKDQISLLLQLLEYFKQILLDQKLKDREDVYMPLVQIEIFARDMACFSYSFHPSNITEDVIRKMFLSSCEVLDKVKHLDSKAIEIGPRFPLSKFPKTYKLGFIDFLLGNLGELLKYDPASIAPGKHHIEELQLHLKSLTSFLRRISGLDIDKHTELKNLDDNATCIAYKLEYLIDSIEIDTRWYHFFWFYHLLDELRILNKEASGIHLTTMNIAKAQILKNVTQVSPELVVDLIDEEKFITDQLARGPPRRAIVSIVGMPGIGKTTIARKVYNKQKDMRRFHCQAWCTVSQVHDKRELLLEILSDIHGLTDDIHRMSNEDLESKLRQCLLKKKYLIVMDDIWDAGAWNDLQNSFPDNLNGSRILITSRLRELALEIEPDGEPLTLRPFSDDESWNFLERKVFQGESCPEELLAVGAKIAHHCQGLPLAIVAIAGVLQTTEQIEELWEEIAESLSTKVLEDPTTRCMEIIELSYKHLPEYLKPCFLYLGVFLDDRDIQVSKLVRFWLAEGFIQNTESKTVEDVAEAYLADLISRSLVMISKTRSNGKVKTCRLHDLIRDFCRSKAKDENFFQPVTRCDKPYSSFPTSHYGFELDFYHHSSPIAFEAYRLSIFLKRNNFVQSRPSGPGTHSLIFFAATDSEPGRPYDISFICHCFKFLRVLDFECINIGVSFPVEIGLLVRLRYLSVSGYLHSVPQTIVNLRELETLVVKGLSGRVVLPECIWHMTRLRHLHVNIHVTFNLGNEELGDSFQLGNMVSLSRPSFSCGEDIEKIMKRLPKLRKLSCIFFESQGSSKNCNQFPRLNFITQLESLKMFYYGSPLNTGEFNLPPNVKELSLSNFPLTWNNISAIGRLPNLAVLKLLSGAFEGRKWDMREEEFQELKFLKLDNVNISQWNACYDHLPKLERLVIQNCKDLEKIPYDFANITTLETIEVHWCGQSAEESAKEIRKATGEIIEVLISSSLLRS